MIQNLEIQNFKSIKELKLECKRVNALIGKPNAGKSNFLESLGLFSLVGGYRVRDFVRMDTVAELFFDCDLAREIRVVMNNVAIVLKKEGNVVKATREHRIDRHEEKIC